MFTLDLPVLGRAESARPSCGPQAIGGGIFTEANEGNEAMGKTFGLNFHRPFRME
jgi:hypothetical protein